ncbi:hypothetical protein HDV00_006937 [Rhizophlyctis rosea]|nr:hypothetical protein HDV00_006937 [Rhizophlyctis rosea]
MPPKRKGRVIESESDEDVAAYSPSPKKQTVKGEMKTPQKGSPSSPQRRQTRGSQPSSANGKQMRLEAFFKSPSKPSPSKSNDMEVDEEPEEYGDSYDDDDNSGSPKKRGGKKGGAQAFSGGKLAGTDLPPINDIDAIFTDMVKRTPKLTEVAERLQGRKLRVATMCSGTESPLLALDLISRALEDIHGTKLDVEHVFSCEIEPFKQAYIERNFKPPILFRDVCELGDDVATTAYGSKVAVPGNVDMLVAGTSCVDYSNLNNQKKTLEQKGESGRTFMGMLNWVKKHRPPIVILENVCGAPWEKVQDHFRKAKYHVRFARFDTKDYYIPHTRTRVYLFAVTAEKGSTGQLPDKWYAMVKELARPASSPLEAFMLPSDDPRIHQGREELAQKKAGGKKAGRIDWARCESRHQLARDTEKLGIKRPLTAWQDGSICDLPDFAWNDWGRGQTERVLDLMDINTLRMAQKGVDVTYKTIVWNLSQNVDRTTASNRPGICPCLTPSMIPYVTNRGGPLIGLEALSLQGLPINELILTRESQDNLADLAGNAMTSTVVGTCMISALILANKLLTPGSASAKPVKRSESSADAQTVVGEEMLDAQPLDLATASGVRVGNVLKDAMRSARYCECEGRTGTSNEPIQICSDCSFTSCQKCGKRPEHNYTVMKDLMRVDPAKFEREITKAIPMRVNVRGVDAELLDSCKSAAEADVDGSMWLTWRRSVLEAIPEAEFRFKSVKRQDIWLVMYDSPTAILELWLDPLHPEWRIIVKTPTTEAVNSKLRALLTIPVARLKVSGESLLDGVWEICLPTSKSFKVTVTGEGELVPSWEARLGLTEDQYKGKKWWSTLRILGVPGEAKSYLDREIAGTYDLFEKCGTAMGALHKKRGTKEDEGQRPLFFFLEPTRCEETDQDPFVFSTSIRRIGYEDERMIVASLDPSWRPNDDKGPKQVNCHVKGKWLPCPAVKVSPAEIDLKATDAAVVATPLAADSIGVTCSGSDGCKAAAAIVSCKVPLGRSDALWPQDSWGTIDLLHKGRQTFDAISWITERVSRLTALANWMEVDASDITEVR